MAEAITREQPYQPLLKETWMYDFEAPFAHRDDHGEGPNWQAETATLWRVDVHVGLVHALDVATGQQKTWHVGTDVSFVLPTTSGEVAVGHGLDIKALSADGSTRVLSTIEADPITRLNDGKVDPFGRIITGSMSLTLQNDPSLFEDPSAVARDASLFQVTADGSVTTLGADMMLSNGLDWDRDRNRFYHIDSVDQRIYLYDLDPESGAYSNRRPFADIPKDDGLPDGLVVDAEGGVWVAVFFGGEVRRYDPDGQLSERVKTPVSCPTSLCFGGHDLRTLYVTTSSRYAVDARAEPLAGAVLACAPGVSGRVTLPFDLSRG